MVKISQVELRVYLLLKAPMRETGSLCPQTRTLVSIQMAEMVSQKFLLILGSTTEKESLILASTLLVIGIKNLKDNNNIINSSTK